MRRAMWRLVTLYLAWSLVAQGSTALSMDMGGSDMEKTRVAQVLEKALPAEWSVLSVTETSLPPWMGSGALRFDVEVGPARAQTASIRFWLMPASTTEGRAPTGAVGLYDGDRFSAFALETTGDEARSLLAAALGRARADLEPIFPEPPHRPEVVVPGGGMPPPMPEQGCMTTCVYCSDVHPGVGKKCPCCGGRKTMFQPAQMMDEWSSWNHMVEHLQRLLEAEAAFRSGEPTKEQAEQLYRRYISVLEQVEIYGFSPRKRLASRIRKLEKEFGLAPTAR